MSGRQSCGGVIAEIVAGGDLIETSSRVGHGYGRAGDGSALCIYDGALKAGGVGLTESCTSQNETQQESENTPKYGRAHHRDPPNEQLPGTLRFAAPSRAN